MDKPRQNVEAARAIDAAYRKGRRDGYAQGRAVALEQVEGLICELLSELGEVKP